ncbi:glycoside hydrolase/deacetylase [Trichodelitschia bisporula]|uniref:Glycoside hydrolase/deacetylase n=1 Tax=Trichodelitschia bisporula TaxID=703511 RepID=A0A6G1HZG6_9PEZI|nr:glycoside hydrolase/deacetylase [Trichodelitschia bisporula]
MRLPIALAALTGLVAAHSESGTPGAPRLVGSRALADLHARGLLRPPVTHDFEPVYGPEPGRRVERRQERRCGPGMGACAAGQCCSAEGYCGTSKDACAGPDCQLAYGPACDGNGTPPGAKTYSGPRPALGSVPVGGEGIYDCSVTGTVALTFDDGPYVYTERLLDLLDKYNARATFFITGNNLGKGEIDNTFYPWAGTIRRMHASGHQVASHTWSHQDLSVVGREERRAQMEKNEMALRNVLGFYPTYMRPPYSSCTAQSGCQADMAELGYHVSYFGLDTEDYLNTTPDKAAVPRNNFVGNISTKSSRTGQFLVIAHDIHEQTVLDLAEYMLKVIQFAGYRAVTMGECLGDPVENWYRKSGGSAVPPKQAAPPPGAGPKPPVKVSDDGACAGQTGSTCMGSTFGNCCSVNGWCGATPAYCGTGCQAGFGNCGENGVAVAPPPRPPPGTALPVSEDSSCGERAGTTCMGSTFGNCCSVYGWCGATVNHCTNGCQFAYGLCGAP